MTGSLVVRNGYSPATQRTLRRPFRVVSWNIRVGEQVEKATRLLAEAAPLQQADIILLQEMDSVGTASIAAALELNYAYVAAVVHPRSGREFGNAVLSPWPLRAVGTVPLPYRASAGGTPRVALHATVASHGVEVQAWSVHTENPTVSWAMRFDQYRAVTSAIAASTAAHVVVGGDFNTATPRALKALNAELEAVGARRVTDGSCPTMRRDGRDFTLDHIFARALEGVDAGAVDCGEASDHRPVWTELVPAESPVAI